MEWSKRTVAVTGASGMLGAYICRSLLARGARVRGVVRNPGKAAFLADEGVEFATADLADRAALTAAFEGTDAVVSNAALFSLTNQRWADNYRANKEGTENVYGAAADAGVRRMVQISTCGVYKMRPGATFHEDAPQIDGSKRQGGAYRATKQISEQLAWDLADRAGIALTAIRPAGIYGSRDSNTMPPFYRMLGWPVTALPTLKFPFVYAGDVADAVAEALANDASAGKPYNTAGVPTSLYAFYQAVKAAAGGGAPAVALPVPVGVKADNGRAEADLGYRDRPLADALAEVVATDRKHGFLSR